MKKLVAKAKKTAQSVNGEGIVIKNIMREIKGADPGQAFAMSGTWPRPGIARFDLSRIPGRSVLKTSLQVQACTKDNGACTCAECLKTPAADGMEVGVQEEAETSGTEPVARQRDAQGALPSLQNTSFDEVTTANTEKPFHNDATAMPLIVEDVGNEVLEGQMTKIEFLRRLRSEICSTIEPVLATVGQTTERCPYLHYWFNLYEEKDASHIERIVKKYAPDTVNATTAQQYISTITLRALQSARVWASTGKLSGVPEGVRATPLGQTVEGHSSPLLAKAKEGGVRDANDPQSIQERLGRGYPLEGSVRSRMESAFGMNFSHVRAHTGTVASDLSRQVNARAFTIGNHVAFGKGEYRPGTLVGDALIAHELAHTVQQQGALPSVQNMGTEVDNYNALEQDADKAAAHVISSLYSGTTSLLSNVSKKTIRLLRKSGLSVQRCSATPARSTTPAVAPPVAAPSSTGTPAGATPCPTTVRVGALAPRNHSDLSSTEKERYRTELGVMSQMVVGPGPDHTGHCMKESLTTVSDSCPTAGRSYVPCSGNKCLDINRYGSMWGVSDGPTSFLDMHRTRSTSSLLEGTGVNSCSIVCEQTYSCDRTQPATGTFRITRNFQAGTHTRSDGSTMHITTGTVTKTAVSP